MIRLQKVIADAGHSSRRKAENLIQQGRVLVDGQVAVIGMKVDPHRVTITIDGRVLAPRTESQPRTYIMLHKPKGIVTTARDPRGRKTVLQLITGIRQRIYPVGRLDRMTTGLLLLTDDGALTHRLTHPSFEVAKTYRVSIRGVPSRDTLRVLRSGVELEDGITHPASVRVVGADGDQSSIELIIHEGRNRQVRRMMAAVGHEVLHLHRSRFGPLGLGTLQVGAWRRLSRDEQSALKRCVGHNG